VTLSRFEQVAPKLARAVKAGASFDEACQKHGVNVHTAQTWLRNGRRDPEGRYGTFAAAVDAAKSSRAAAKVPPSSEGLTRDEYERLLAEAARAGSVPALKLWADTHPTEGQAAPGDALSFLDELLQDRRGRRG
jgi:hypothetical protein